MKCKLCNTEMMIDSVKEDKENNAEIFNYKCPNPQCSNYGYKKEEK